MDRVHFDWRCRERPALALRPVRDPVIRLRRTRVNSIENLGQRLLPILRGQRAKPVSAVGDTLPDGIHGLLLRVLRGSSFRLSRVGSSRSMPFGGSESPKLL
jgi:hypothetical protein